MRDLDQLKRAAYDEWRRVPDRDHMRSQWIMDQATFDHIASLLDQDPRTLQVYLFGVPIEVREGAEGVHLERTPESWQCRWSPQNGGWHERGCPHVDWSLAE
jgi:hypothetical protein